jgi:hypothetical protein
LWPHSVFMCFIPPLVSLNSSNRFLGAFT